MIIGTGAGLLLLLQVVSGCATLEDYIRFRVPPEVQRVVRVGPTVPLSQSGVVASSWSAYIESNTQLLQSNVRKAWGTLYFVQGLLEVGVSGLEAPGGFPVGGAILALLFGTGGLMLERPGQGKKTAGEKEASHKHGRKVVMDVLALVGGSRRPRGNNNPTPSDPEA